MGCEMLALVILIVNANGSVTWSDFLMVSQNENAPAHQPLHQSARVQCGGNSVSSRLHSANAMVSLGARETSLSLQQRRRRLLLLLAVGRARHGQAGSEAMCCVVEVCESVILIDDVNEMVSYKGACCYCCCSRESVIWSGCARMVSCCMISECFVHGIWILI